MSHADNAGEMEFAARIGLDWGDGAHAWVLQEAGHAQRQRGTLDNTPEAVECWAMQLQERFGGRAVAIAVEQSRGAVVWMLSKYAHVVLYPIHPSTSHGFRTAMFPSGSKDDPRDADLLLDLLTRHPERLRALRPDTEPTRKLQALVEKRRQLVDQQTAHTNRITDLLKMHFPQVLGWVDKIGSPIAAAFLQRWPTLEQVQKEEDQTIRAFFHQHGSRSEQRIAERLKQMRSAVAVTQDAAVVEPGVLMVGVLLALVAELRRGIVAVERAIDEVVAVPHLCLLSGGRQSHGPAAAGRFRIAAGTLRQCRGDAVVQRDCAGDLTKRQPEVDPFPLGLSEVSAADLSRVRRALHSALSLGQRLLPAAALLRQGSPCGGTVAGVQMDSHPVPLLAIGGAL